MWVKSNIELCVQYTSNQRDGERFTVVNMQMVSETLTLKSSSSFINIVLQNTSGIINIKIYKTKQLFFIILSNTALIIVIILNNISMNLTASQINDL